MRDRTAMNRYLMGSDNRDQSLLYHAYHHKGDDKQAKTFDFLRLFVINRIEIIN